jgi:hypothetical protein
MKLTFKQPNIYYNAKDLMYLGFINWGKQYPIHLIENDEVKLLYLYYLGKVTTFIHFFLNKWNKYLVMMNLIKICVEVE